MRPGDSESHGQNWLFSNHSLGNAKNEPSLRTSKSTCLCHSLGLGHIDHELLKLNNILKPERDKCWKRASVLERSNWTCSYQSRKIPKLEWDHLRFKLKKSRFSSQEYLWARDWKILKISLQIILISKQTSISKFPIQGPRNSKKCASGISKYVQVKLRAETNQK